MRRRHPCGYVAGSAGVVAARPGVGRLGTGRLSSQHSPVPHGETSPSLEGRLRSTVEPDPPRFDRAHAQHPRPGVAPPGPRPSRPAPPAPRWRRSGTTAAGSRSAPAWPGATASTAAITPAPAAAARSGARPEPSPPRPRLRSRRRSARRSPRDRTDPVPGAEPVRRGRSAGGSVGPLARAGGSRGMVQPAGGSVAGAEDGPRGTRVQQAAAKRVWDAQRGQWRRSAAGATTCEDAAQRRWAGAGSNRRPSAFQVTAPERCAHLRHRTSLTSGLSIGGTPCVGSQAKGLIHRRSVKRAKSVSADTSGSPCSRASAARWASEMRLPRS